MYFQFFLEISYVKMDSLAMLVHLGDVLGVDTVDGVTHILPAEQQSVNSTLAHAYVVHCKCLSPWYVILFS